jgi:phosphate:Na+ symporter
MNQWLLTIGSLAGGLGLFLLAVGMITDGLKVAAGHSLKDMLGKWTKSPGHGIVTGLIITAIVQSSSAVTVATIGFVNAGLINLYQALGVVYGANIGTTMTGWLVAIIGFKIKVEVFALPMVGLGMILRLTGGESKRASTGLALAGFGLFFIGIDVLKEAFEGMATTLDLQRLTLDGLTGVLLYVGIGFLMTVLTQSSSAAIAITLTAASGGMLGMYAAAATIIGANIGTTSTAALAVIGATSNAKRVAAAHVVFNVVTGVAAVALLPVLFWVVVATEKMLNLQDNPAVTLAMFHTVFNILGVLLMWPVSNSMARFLGKRFVTREEIESRPRYLDRTVAMSPVLAINALMLELTRVAAVVRRMALAALSTESGSIHQLRNEHAIVIKLTDSMSEFISMLEQGALTAEVSQQLGKLLRAEQHLLLCSEQALEVASGELHQGVIRSSELQDANAHYHASVARLLELTNPEAEDFSINACDESLEQAQGLYETTRAVLLQAASEKRLPAHTVIELLEQNSRIRRMSRQMVKALRDLNELYRVNEVVFSEPSTASSAQGVAGPVGGEDTQTGVS